MTFKAKLMMFTAAIAFSGSMAFAAITADDVLASYGTDAGYSYVQVTEGLTQIKVEAVKDGVMIEVIYDKETGSVLKSESQSAEAEYLTKTGVEVRQVSKDFGDGGDDNGIENEDESGDDNGIDNNDDSGDDNGVDNEGEHDNSGSGSENSGSDHSGSDHDSDED